MDALQAGHGHNLVFGLGLAEHGAVGAVPQERRLPGGFAQEFHLAQGDAEQAAFAEGEGEGDQAEDLSGLSAVSHARQVQVVAQGCGGQGRAVPGVQVVAHSHEAGRVGMEVHHQGFVVDATGLGGDGSYLGGCRCHEGSIAPLLRGSDHSGRLVRRSSDISSAMRSFCSGVASVRLAMNTLMRSLRSPVPS